MTAKLTAGVVALSGPLLPDHSVGDLRQDPFSKRRVDFVDGFRAFDIARKNATANDVGND